MRRTGIERRLSLLQGYKIARYAEEAPLLYIVTSMRSIVALSITQQFIHRHVCSAASVTTWPPWIHFTSAVLTAFPCMKRRVVVFAAIASGLPRLESQHEERL